MAGGKPFVPVLVTAGSVDWFTSVCFVCTVECVCSRFVLFICLALHYKVLIWCKYRCDGINGDRSHFAYETGDLIITGP